MATFFVDENDLALGKALAKLHGNVLFPGHPDLPAAPRQSLDDEWLEVVGTQGLVVITRDQRIRYKPVEKRMWVEHGVRGFVLTGTTSQSTADSLSLLENHWAKMATIIERNPLGPSDVRHDGDRRAGNRPFLTVVGSIRRLCQSVTSPTRSALPDEALHLPWRSHPENERAPQSRRVLEREVPWRYRVS